MKKSIFCVLLAALVAIMPVAFLCSCNGCSSKTANMSTPVQDIAAVQVKPIPAEPIAEAAAEPVETAPAAQPAENVAEEAAVESLAEEDVVEPEGEEESVPVGAEEEDSAEESFAEKAPVQEAEQPAEAEPESVVVASEPAAESDEKNCGGHIITLGLSPWGWQYFHTDESGMDDENSSYGLGGKLAYTYLFSNGFYVGAEAAYETYFIAHKDNFSDIMFFVDGGYNFALTEKFGLYAGLGGGLELECYKDACSAVGVFKADLGLGYSLAEHWIVGAGCDFIFGFPMKSGTNYMEFQIVPCIMGSYRF